MRIMIGMGHPKDVHFWKNIINNLANNGHEIKIVAWDKDVTLYLLDTYGFSYEVLGKSCKSLIGKAYRLSKAGLISLKIAKKFEPDILIGREPNLAHISKLIRRPFIMISDTEHATLSHLLTYPFSDAICTPLCFEGKINPRKHITFKGYQELAYLHPNYFKPDSSILSDLELSKNDTFIILRFISWSASHDVGHHGFTNKEQLVRKLKEYGRVFIIPEREVIKKLGNHKMLIPPEKIHDLLYYATMYVGEGATMASESAILGTPAIYVNTLRLGYLDELEKKYDLVYNFNTKNAQKYAIKKAIELLQDKNLKNRWRRKRDKLLKESVDVTAWMTIFIENYSRR